MTRRRRSSLFVAFDAVSGRFTLCCMRCTLLVICGSNLTSYFVQARFWQKVGLSAPVCCPNPKADLKQQLKALTKIEWHHRRLFPSDCVTMSRLLATARPLKQAARHEMTVRMDCAGVLCKCAVRVCCADVLCG